MNNLQKQMRCCLPIPTSQKLKEELEHCDHALYKCATEVEKDEILRTEIADWAITSADGLQ